MIGELRKGGCERELLPQTGRVGSQVGKLFVHVGHKAVIKFHVSVIGLVCDSWDQNGVLTSELPQGVRDML